MRAARKRVKATSSARSVWNELPERWRRILQQLGKGWACWRSPAQVAAALGWDVETTTDELAALDVAGWLDVRVREHDVVVCLSPWGAKRLGLRLIEVGPGELPNWWRGRPPAVLARTAPTPREGPEPIAAPDPEPAVERLVEWNDGAAVHTRVPTVLVGLSLTPWPGPSARSRGQPCPACGGVALPRNAYCLWCDRSGSDPELQISRYERQHGAYDRASAAMLTATRLRHKTRRQRRQQLRDAQARKQARHHAWKVRVRSLGLRPSAQAVRDDPET